MIGHPTWAIDRRCYVAAILGLLVIDVPWMEVV
jgi:hypothetical protein